MAEWQHLTNECGAHCGFREDEPGSPAEGHCGPCHLLGSSDHPAAVPKETP